MADITYLNGGEMPNFSASSNEKLNAAHPELQRLFTEVVKHFDCTVVCGFRGKAEQDMAVAGGNSKTPWPTSKHNKQPSLAVDVMPYPVDWSGSKESIERVTLFAGFVLGVASQLGIKIKWGHDWNSDTVPDSKGFVDRPHYELIL
jgi:hypothetical protein